MNSEIITQKELMDKLSFDSESGLFRWKLVKSGIKLNSIAGCSQNGYIKIRINNKLYFAHRLAWLYVHGEMPNCLIDHINGIKSDNRIENLRIADFKQNAKNSKIPSSNTSGFKGVSFNKRTNKWVAQAKVNMKNIFLGRFDSPEIASSVYREFAKENHGEFFRNT